MRPVVLDGPSQPRPNPAYGVAYGQSGGVGGAVVGSAGVPDRPDGFAASQSRRVTWTTAPSGAGSQGGPYAQNVPWTPGVPGVVSVWARSSRAQLVVLDCERTTRTSQIWTLPAGEWTLIWQAFTALTAAGEALSPPSLTAACYIRTVAQGAQPVQVGDTLDMCGTTLVPGTRPVLPTPGQIFYPRPLPI